MSSRIWLRHARIPSGVYVAHVKAPTSVRALLIAVCISHNCEGTVSGGVAPVKSHSCVVMAVWRPVRAPESAVRSVAVSAIERIGESIGIKIN